MTSPAAVATSELECTLVRGRTGRTQIASLRQQFPQRVTVPMYADPHNLSTAFVCIQNPSGGVFPGDELVTRIVAGEDTSVHLTYQSATQVFAGEPGTSQHTELELGPRSVLEYDAKTVIPHDGASYRQHTVVRVCDTSLYVGWDAFASGRIGHGERFSYQRLLARTDIWHGGRLAACDTVLLAPPEDDPGAAGVLGGNDYVASMLVVAPGLDLATLAGEMHAALDTTPGLRGAASALPGEIGLSVRILADRAPALRRIQQELRNIVRLRVLGLGPLTPRM